MKKRRVISNVALVLGMSALTPAALAADVHVLYGWGYDNTLNVWNVDPNASQVTLYNQDGTVAQTVYGISGTVNTVLGSPTVTSSVYNSVYSGNFAKQVDVDFTQLNPGSYFVTQTVNGVESNKQYNPIYVSEGNPTVVGSNDGSHTITVTGTPNATIELRDANGNVLSTVTADQNGKYVFSNIAPGNYLVDQTANGSQSYWEWVQVSDYKYFDLTVNVNTINIANATPGAQISLYNYDFNWNNPTSVSGNTYSITVYKDTYEYTTADASGNAAFPNVNPGYYFVTQSVYGKEVQRNFVTLQYAAPSASIGSDETSVMASGVTPGSLVRIYDSYGNLYDEQIASSSTVTFSYVDPGQYFVTQSSGTASDDYYDGLESNPSNQVTVNPYILRDLVAGWNTISVPYVLNSPHLSDILDTSALDEALAYQNGSWVQITSANEATVLSQPLTGLYLKIKDGSPDVYAALKPSSSPNAPSTMTINQGWNLVGPSLMSGFDSYANFLNGVDSTSVPVLVDPNGSGYAATNPATDYSDYVGNSYGYWLYAKSSSTLIGQIPTGQVGLPDMSLFNTNRSAAKTSAHKTSKHYHAKKYQGKRS